MESDENLTQQHVFAMFSSDDLSLDHEANAVLGGLSGAQVCFSDPNWIHFLDPNRPSSPSSWDPWPPDMASHALGVRKSRMDSKTCRKKGCRCSQLTLAAPDAPLPCRDRRACCLPAMAMADVGKCADDDLIGIQIIYESHTSDHISLQFCISVSSC